MDGHDDESRNFFPPSETHLQSPRSSQLVLEQPTACIVIGGCNGCCQLQTSDQIKHQSTSLMTNNCSEDEQGVVLIASEEALDAFSDNVSSLWSPSTIPVVEPLHSLSTLEFCRDFVGRSRPCILRDTSTSTSALAVPSLPRWTVDDIQKICGDELEITVNVTPDGHGDAIRTIVARKSGEDYIKCSDIDGIRHEQVFLLPEERRMQMSSFVRALRAKGLETPSSVVENAGHHHGDDAAHWHELNQLDAEGLPMLFGTTRITHAGHTAVTLDRSSQSSTAIGDDNVFYYSLQNDCLRSECTALLRPLQASAAPLLHWAEQAFGTGPPDAVNIWIGDERAHSSLHKDPYENLFYVASGEKIFTLYPPSDAAFLPIVAMPTRRFVSRSSEDDEGGLPSWHIVEEYQDHDDNVGNCIDHPCVKTTPWIYASQGSAPEYLHPLTVRVKAGDVLYLPSLWFHAVSQSQETVAVNWWFDMQFLSPLFCYFQLLENCRLRVGQTRRDVHNKASSYGTK